MITTKTFRIFISSTFSDMVHERRYLQKEIFPKLREFCKRNGAKFQAVDLRWGVNEETQQDQKTMQLCLKEIHRCQQISPKPNFIVLVGDRYGWQPIPDIIPGKEMKAIFSVLPTNEKGIIDKWYWEDTNAIPAEFVLQPKGDAYKEYPVWEKVESALRSILRSAVNKINFTKEQRIKYYTSATHQEIIRGALLPDDAKEHVFAYLRTIDNLPDNNDAGAFTDIFEGIRDSYASEMISKLKEELQGKLDESHIYNYSADWVPEKKDINIIALEAFGNRVYEDLKQIIESDLQEISSQSESAKELETHKTFRKNLLKGFVGREETIESILDYLAGKEQKPFFCLTGPSGSGKSSVMAKAAAEAEKIPGTTIICRFSGTTPASSEVLSLFMGISEQIAGLLGLNIKELSEQIRTDQNITEEIRLQKKVFQHLIGKAGEGRITLQLFIDSLDQVRNIDNIQIQDWFPDLLQENVRIVVSILEQYKEKVNNGLIHELPPMPSDIAEKILKGWFGSIEPTSRTLTEKQFSSIIKGFSKIGLPLFLKICFELAKEWRSFENNSFSAESMDDLLTRYFLKLEKDHDAEILKTAIGYMLSGKDGLTEDEILDMFAFDDRKQQDAYHYEGPSFWEYYLDKRVFKTHRDEIEQMGRFPVIVWSRLLFDLLPFLSERDIPGGRAFVFFHRIMAEFARNRYYRPYLDRWHNNLADYFEESSLFLDPARLKPNIRRVIEQPYQETLSGQWDDLYEKTLGNYKFVEAKIKANMLNELLADYEFAERLNSEKKLSSSLSIWRSFMQSRMHILRRGNPEWPAYKIFLQITVEHADDSPLTLQADKYLDEGNVNWNWLKRTQRVKHAGVDPCVGVVQSKKSFTGFKILKNDQRIICWESSLPGKSANFSAYLLDKNGSILKTLEGHKQGIQGVCELSNNNILTWSNDQTLRLWDSEGSMIVVMAGDKGRIKGAFELSDKRIISWSVEGLIKIWDSSGELQETLIGHTKSINGVYELAGGRILSWSQDKTLIIWNRNGQALIQLEGHTESVESVLKLSNNYFLSIGLNLLFNRDKTPERKLLIWDQEGHLINELTGHDGLIKGAIEISGQRILTWSSDNSPRLWDFNGTCLAILYGHQDSIVSVKELCDGYILTISDDRTIKLWDRNAKLLSTFLNISSGIVGVKELSNNKLISWHGDGTMRIWNRNGALLKLMNAHNSAINGIIKLSDGLLLSYSNDRTLKIWNSKGDLVNTLYGHQHGIRKVRESNEGRVLSLSWDSIRLWENLENQNSILEGHSNRVMEIRSLPNEDYLSRAEDKTPIIWRKNGLLKKHIIGHTNRVNGIIELYNQNLLSWSEDKTIRIWDKNYNPIVLIKLTDNAGSFTDKAIGLTDGRILFLAAYSLTIFTPDGTSEKKITSHKDLISGAMELSDQSILSWSDDNSLIRYDKFGNPLYFFLGHTRSVTGAVELSDNRIVSLSGDNTVRIWDNEGNLQSILTINSRPLDPIYTSFEVRRVIELSDKTLLFSIKDGTIQHWNNMGSIKKIYISEEDCLKNNPEFIKFLLRFSSNFFLKSKTNYVYLTNLKNSGVVCQWHGETIQPHKIEVDGKIIVSQANGQVCFLKTYIGNERVTLDGLEKYMFENHN